MSIDDAVVAAIVALAFLAFGIALAAADWYSGHAVKSPNQQDPEI